MPKQAPVEKLIEAIEDWGRADSQEAERKEWDKLTSQTIDPALLANLRELVELWRLVECYEFERLSSTGPCRPDGFYDRRAQFRCNGRAYDATAATATEALRAAFKEAGLGVEK
jgi:hypothetical protein